MPSVNPTSLREEEEARGIGARGDDGTPRKEGLSSTSNMQTTHIPLCVCVCDVRVGVRACRVEGGWVVARSLSLLA